MITWIQIYFQKHFRSIFAVLLGVIIISFIGGINASGGFNRGDRRTADRPFFGHNLSSEQDVVRMTRDGQLSAMLMQAQIRYQEQLDAYAKTRVAAMALADELHLPAPTEKEVAAHIGTLSFFHDEQGRFDQKRYADFGDSLKNNPQFNITDASRVFHDDTRIETVNKLIGGPGYVLPADVRDLLNRTDAKWSISIATLDYASFDAGVTVTDEALKKFFEENSTNYQVPPRAKLSAVSFNGEEFIPAGVPMPEEQLRNYYNANLARFPVPPDPTAKDVPAVPTAGTDNFAKVRPQVESAFRSEMGSRAAVKVANDFAVALYERKTKANSPELAAFLTSQNRTATTIAPFSPDSPPATMPWLYQYGEQLSRLGQERFFSDPLPTPSGAVVLLWNDTLPAYQPALAEVREKVTADYKEREKRLRFVAQGQQLKAKLTAAVKAGTSFEKAAADAKLEVKSFANFTLQDAPKDLPPAARSALQTIKPGEVADMIPSAEKGLLVYAAQKQLPDLAPDSPRFTEIRSRLMGYISSAASNATLSSLVKAELDKTAPDKATTTR